MRLLLISLGDLGIDRLAMEWNILREDLISAGFELVSEADSSSYDLCLCIDFVKTPLVDKLDSQRSVLFQLEPISINPRQFTSSAERRFGLILSQDKSRRETNNLKYWSPGQFTDSDLDLMGEPSGDTERPFSVATIVANKNSFVRVSQYGLRRRVIRALAREGESFAFAGQGWDRSRGADLWIDCKELVLALFSGLPFWKLQLRFRLRRPSMNCYVGTPESARDFLKQTEIAVVIENEASYFSEKLTDALFSRCHVVYVGPHIDGLERLRNVSTCAPSVKDIMETIARLRVENSCNITYTPEELEVLGSLGHRVANDRFIKLFKAEAKRIMKALDLSPRN